MKNYMKYDYHVTDEGLPNVLCQRDKGQEYKACIVNPTLYPVVLELNKKKPQWEFIGAPTHSMNVNGVVKPVMAILHVLEKNEKLGVISIASRYTRRGVKTVIELSNERIREARSRSGGFKTQSVAAAVTKALKMFRPETYVERMRKASEIVESFAHRNAKAEVGDADMAYDIFAASVKNAITKEPYLEPLMEIAKRNAAPEQLPFLDNMVSSQHKSENASKLYKAVTAKRGVTVLLLGENYVVSNKDELKSYTTDTLPDWIKPKLGMLKLLEGSQGVANVGIRANNTTFFIVEDEA
jgi:hypothetical protein